MNADLKKEMLKNIELTKEIIKNNFEISLNLMLKQILNLIY